MSLKIAQWNLCSFQAQHNHLLLLLSKINPDVLALQETRFKNSEHSEIRNYKCFFKNRSQAAGGVAIYVKNIISTSPVAINSNHEVVAVRILCDTQITLCNVYFPKNSNTFTLTKRDIGTFYFNFQCRLFY